MQKTLATKIVCKEPLDLIPFFIDLIDGVSPDLYDIEPALEVIREEGDWWLTLDEGETVNIMATSNDDGDVTFTIGNHNVEVACVPANDLKQTAKELQKFAADNRLVVCYKKELVAANEVKV